MNILEEGILLLYENLESDLAIGRFIALLVRQRDALMGSCWWALPNRFYVSPENHLVAHWHKELYEMTHGFYQLFQEQGFSIQTQRSFLGQPLIVIGYPLSYQKQLV